MTKTTFAALAFVLSTGLAHAQSVDVAAVRAAHEAGGPPGTVGAMASATYGIATSAQDVELQQRGMTTMAQGAQPIVEMGSARKVETAGTVGSAPGSTPGE